MKWIVILLVVIVAGAVGSYWYEGYSAESKLLEQPVYRVLKKHEPAVFDKLVDEYKLYAREETRRENSSTSPIPRSACSPRAVSRMPRKTPCWRS